MIIRGPPLRTAPHSAGPPLHSAAQRWTPSARRRTPFAQHRTPSAQPCTAPDPLCTASDPLRTVQHSARPPPHIAGERLTASAQRRTAPDPLRTAPPYHSSIVFLPFCPSWYVRFKPFQFVLHYTRPCSIHFGTHPAGDPRIENFLIFPNPFALLILLSVKLHKSASLCLLGPDLVSPHQPDTSLNHDDAHTSW